MQIHFDGKRVRQWYINRSHRTLNDWSFFYHRSSAKQTKQFCPACPPSGQSSLVFNCSLYRNKRKRWNILLPTNVNAITISCVIPFISEYPAHKIMNFIFAFMWKVQGILHYSVRQWWNQVLHHIIIHSTDAPVFCFSSLQLKWMDTRGEKKSVCVWACIHITHPVKIRLVHTATALFSFGSCSSFRSLVCLFVYLFTRRSCPKCGTPWKSSATRNLPFQLSSSASFVFNPRKRCYHSVFDFIFILI